MIQQLNHALSRRIGPTLANWRIGLNLHRFRRHYLARRLPPISRPTRFRDKIEVVVTCYNHADFLEEAWQSIVCQEWAAPITVTFADDSSTDETPAIIQSIARNADPRRFAVQTLRSTTNLRQCGLINEAVSRSTNELFIILNDDDLLAPDCLEKLVTTLEQHPELVLLGGSSLWFDDATPLPSHERLPLSELRLVVSSPTRTTRYRHLNDLNMTHSSTAFFKSAWEAVGGYYAKDRRIHPAANEDRDFQMRVNALGPVGVYPDYPLAYWRTGSSHGSEF